MDSAEQILNSWVEAGKVPGLAITVLRSGKVIFQKGCGFSDIDAGRGVDPTSTLFRAASVSKPIAATALLRLVENGLIDLDASLYEYVPEFPRKKYDFTIRQLAGHTAGIRGYRGKEYALNKPMSIGDSLGIFGEDPLLFKPGTGYNYNSFDWVLLSYAMEKVTGSAFGEYVERNVLRPLDMTHTIPERAGDQPLEKAIFYSPAEVGFRKASPVNNEYKLAGGGYLTTTADISKLGQAYLAGSIGNPELVSEFLSAQQVAGKSTYYGLGWEVSADRQGRSFYGHTGNSIGAFSLFRVYPGFSTAVAILVNATRPDLGLRLEELLEVFVTY